MDQPFYLRERAERCHRLARDCTDPMLRDSLYSRSPKNTPGGAGAQEYHETAVWQAGSGEDDQDAD